MFASWSRPTWSRKNIPAITSGNRKKHGRRRAHGLDDAAAVAADDLSRLHAAADAGAGDRADVAAALGRELSALLSPLVLPHSGSASAADRPTDGSASGVVRRQSCFLSRYHDLQLADRRLLRREARGRTLAVIRLARQIAALGLYRPPGAQHRAAARKYRRAA